MLMLLLATAVAWADDISQEKAQEIAAQAMARICGNQSMASRVGKGVSVKQPKPVLAYTARAAQAEQNDFYVFNNGDSEGFVIVSGNDATIDPVLGFSDSGTFDYDDAPESLKALLAFYSRQVGLLRRQPSALAPHREESFTTGKMVVEPLLTTAWNQSSPYNQLCPKVDGENYPFTGCVAVALAQIANYWKHPQHGRGHRSYWWNPSMYTRFDYSASFSESVYDWDHMLDGYSPGNYTEAEGLAVAQLMRDAGSCIGMMYGYSASDGYSIPQYGLEEWCRYFDYCLDSLKTYTLAADIYTFDDNKAKEAAEFDNIIKRELDKKRPIYCAIAHLNHAVVIDGYTEKDYFHINFGWGGRSDGFYKVLLVDLTTLFPPDREMSRYETITIVTGICPANTLQKGDQYYQLCGNEAELTFIDGKGEVVIPATITDGSGKSYTVTSVRNAFYNDDSHTSVELPSNIRQIGDAAFKGCTQLERVKIPENLESLGTYAFDGCQKLATFEGIVNFRRVPDGLFRNCASLPAITLGENVEEIGSEAFLGCSSLGLMTLPYATTVIHDNAFSNCSSLRSVGSGSPTVIGANAFSGCSSLFYFDWKNVKEVGDYAFAGCGSLNPPNVKSVRKLGDGALGSTKFSRLEFDSLQVLGVNPFSCSELRLGAQAMPEDLTGLNAALTKIEIDPANGKYTVVDNTIYTKDMRSLVYSAYRYNDAYYGEMDRKELIVPEGVERIESKAVRGGTKLGRVTLPASVSEIDTLGFSQCANLSFLYNYAVIPQPLKGKIFLSNPTVHVPLGSKEAYEQAEVWKDMDIVEDLPVPIEEDEEVIDVESKEAKVNAVRIYWLREPKYLAQVAVELVFPSMPKLIYEDGYDDEQHVGRNIVLTSAEGISIKVYGQTYVYDQVTFPHAGYSAKLGKLEFYYDEAAAAAGIDTPSRPDNGIRLQIDRSCVTLSGLAQGTMVTLYTLDGQAVVSTKATFSGNAVVSLPEKGSTAYVLKAGESTFKIGVK